MEKSLRRILHEIKNHIEDYKMFLCLIFKSMEYVFLVLIFNSFSLSRANRCVVSFNTDFRKFSILLHKQTQNMRLIQLISCLVQIKSEFKENFTLSLVDLVEKSNGGDNSF